MKTSWIAFSFAFLCLFCVDSILADPLAPAVEGKKKGKERDKLVFVTGSNIPQRVRVKAIGTDTVSPVRVYTRTEMDRTGQFTTEGILAQDPSVTILTGHGIGSH